MKLAEQASKLAAHHATRASMEPSNAIEVA
jgi:hypothetical protein